MSIAEAIILAIVEGLTEFLPVSSTGHMIIVSSIMGIASDPFTKLFTVAIQLGAILSVIVLYWKKFLPAPGTDPNKMVHFYIKLLVGFIPAVLIGLLFESQIDQLLENVIAVGISLILGGIVFLFLDKFLEKNEHVEEESISYQSSFKIGLFQTLAMIPGVSRSAATIIGGVMEGLTKRAAAEFSFFLAVPTMLGATLFKLYKFPGTFGAAEIKLLVIGNIFAFVVAIIAIKSFINFLTRHGFKLFGYYRIIIGAVIIVLYFLGIELSIV